jgi:hypothetical protein
MMEGLMSNILSDVRVGTVRLQPGDKIIARVNAVLRPGQKSQLKGTLEKWANIPQCDILIVELPLLDVEVKKGQGDQVKLYGVP